jgi:hypothetical protein
MNKNVASWNLDKINLRETITKQTTKHKIFTIFNGIKSLQVKEDCHMTTKAFDHLRNYKVQDKVTKT